MPDFEPVLLANVGQPDSFTRRVYEQRGGYQALRKVLKSSAPKEVIETVKSSGLRGRGGAGFPTGLKWTFLPPNHPGPIYFCLNADESEPGTFNNRILMEDDPHQVLEGLILSCFATQARNACSSHAPGMSHPPKKSVVTMAHTVTTLAYSAMKKKENFIALYSVW